MSDADRERWNERYRAGSYATRTAPAAVVSSWAPVVFENVSRATITPRALDVACGRGRNAIGLAHLGFGVEGIDVSEVALEAAAARAVAEGVSVEWRNRDLDDASLGTDTYELIVVSRFLDRALFPKLQAALSPGGFIIYEQHVVVGADTVPSPAVGGPKSARFRLCPNELLKVFGEFEIAYYSEGLTADPDGTQMALARLIARKPNGRVVSVAIP